MGGTWLQKHSIRCRTVVGSNEVLLKLAAHHAERMSALGLRAAWIDRVYADLLRPKLLGQNLGDYVDRALS